MSRRFCVTCLTVVLLAAGTVSAAEIGLTSVLYPEGKSIDIPLAGTHRAPAAVMKAQVRHRSGQSGIEIQFKNLPPAVLFGGDFVSYVAWSVGPDSTVENLGGVANEKPQGTATFSTAKRDFALMITAEPIATVRTPGELVVFFSGTPAAKNARPTGFTFGGLSDRRGLLHRERESIAGMTYKPNKKNPLELIQAEKAVELLDRFDARNYDARGYDKAVAALSEARDNKGQRRIDACKQVIVSAGQALGKTARMIEAEEETARASEATAARQMLAGKASDLKEQLGATKAKLTETDSRLSQTESELAAARSTIRKLKVAEAHLAGQKDALSKQLSGAVGQMATGVKTDRGYVISVSGTAFPSGKATLTTDAKYVLAKVSGMLLVLPNGRMSIEGHTDSTGSDELNRGLSLARAEAVQTFLREMGVAQSRVSAKGFGADKPIAPNDTPEGRAKNRRVEIVMSERG